MAKDYWVQGHRGLVRYLTDSKDKLLAQVLTVLTSVWTSFFTSECLLVLWRYGLNPWPCAFYESCVPLSSIAQLPGSLVLTEGLQQPLQEEKGLFGWMYVHAHVCCACEWMCTCVHNNVEAHGWCWSLVVLSFFFLRKSLTKLVSRLDRLVSEAQGFVCSSPLWAGVPDTLPHTAFPRLWSPNSGRWLLLQALCWLSHLSSPHSVVGRGLPRARINDPKKKN